MLSVVLLSVIMLNVVVLSVVLLSVFMLNVAVLSVVAPIFLPLSHRAPSIFISKMTPKIPRKY
jgi:hypothetical protein